MTEHEGSCSAPGCERPQAVGREAALELCRQHIALFGARSSRDEWEITRDILAPWVESAKVINDFLVQVLEHALAEAEWEMDLLADHIEKMEAEL